MADKKTNGRSLKKDTKRKRQKEVDIMEGALKVFGEKGYEDTTISAISKAAKIVPSITNKISGYSKSVFI